MARWLFLVAILASPSAALAQVEVETVVANDGDVANESWTGPTLDVQRSPMNEPTPEPAAHEPQASVRLDEGGWLWFGGQTGVLVMASPWVAGGLAAGDAAVAASAIEMGLLGMGTGGLFEEIAKDEDWDRGLGWALAGIYPGVTLGVLSGALGIVTGALVPELFQF
jgi:hypothetical protein